MLKGVRHLSKRGERAELDTAIEQLRAVLDSAPGLARSRDEKRGDDGFRAGLRWGFLSAAESLKGDAFNYSFFWRRGAVTRVRHQIGMLAAMARGITSASQQLPDWEARQARHTENLRRVEMAWNGRTQAENADSQATPVEAANLVVAQTALRGLDPRVEGADALSDPAREAFQSLFVRRVFATAVRYTVDI
jgi:hypothetical protein